jgi:hypothetical protein
LLALRHYLLSLRVHWLRLSSFSSISFHFRLHFHYHWFSFSSIFSSITFLHLLMTLSCRHKAKEPPLSAFFIFLFRFQFIRGFQSLRRPARAEE